MAAVGSSALPGRTSPARVSRARRASASIASAWSVASGVQHAGVQVDADHPLRVDAQQPGRTGLGADRQHDVARLRELHQRRVGAQGMSQRQRAAVGDGALAGRGGRHRRRQPLRQRGQRRGGAGAVHAGAGQDQRPLGVGEHGGGALQRGGVARGRLDRGRRCDLDVLLLREHRCGNFQVDRPRVAGAGRPHRLRHLGRHLGRTRRARRPLGDRLQPQARGRALEAVLGGAADDDDGRGGAQRRGDASAGVEQARARHHQRAGRPVAGARVAVGHVGGGLLVAAGDVADAVGVEVGVDRLVLAGARHAEGDGHPLRGQRAHQCLAAVHASFHQLLRGQLCEAAAAAGLAVSSG